MRTSINPQMQLGEVDISKITFDQKSRDDIPKILKALQYLYTDLEIREKLFKILEKYLLPEKDKKNGRPGMEHWRIFVLAILRLNLNCDYDRLHELANNHSILRQMLGHSSVFDKHYYEVQTIKDNVGLLTPEILDEINQLVVKMGHALLKKNETPLKGRCDSFVVETNVHYPTDINLLLDAMRKVVFLTGSLCEDAHLTDWRQYHYNFKCMKKLMRKAQDKKRGNPKSEIGKHKKEQEIKVAHQNYITTASEFLDKAKATLLKINDGNLLTEVRKMEVEKFIKHAERQINQIERRVLLGETIPHEEKVFSIFQPHTEWISKGKAGVPFELGLRVCVFEDHHQFILHHQVMEKQSDEEIAILITEETKKRFPHLFQASYDRGFHSPSNREELPKILEKVVMPRKGKLSKQALELENSKDFLKARRQHSAVESVINALEVHGLDFCPDHGIKGFKRYVALAIVGYNLGRIGAILKAREQKILERKRQKLRVREPVLKLAA